MEIRFLEAAQHELDEAVDHYNNESPGLSNEFLVEILKVLDRIHDYPDAWHPFSEDTGRCRTRRFPYAVVYEVQPDQILVVAVMHLHRSPDYWRGRSR